jgi:hypothetical protein
MQHVFGHGNTNDKIKCMGVETIGCWCTKPSAFSLIFWIKDIITNLLGASTLGTISTRLKNRSSFNIGTRTPNSLLEVVVKVCQTPLFLVKTLVISSMQLEVVFHLTTTLCEEGKSPRMVAKLAEESMLTSFLNVIDVSFTIFGSIVLVCWYGQASRSSNTSNHWSS